MSEQNESEMKDMLKNWHPPDSVLGEPPYNCSKCGKSFDDIHWYHLTHGNGRYHLCSRCCLVEFIAPELNNAVAIWQWVPTEEDKERMIQ